IRKLESGHVPWRKPRKTFGQPRNLISGKTYRGINSFLLSCSPHSSPFWLTFKQASELDGHVRKGECSSIAVFYKTWETERENPETGQPEEIKVPALRFYHVFNSEQCEGLSHKRLAELQDASSTSAFNLIDQAEAIVAGMPHRPAITEQG